MVNSTEFDRLIPDIVVTTPPLEFEQSLPSITISTYITDDYDTRSINLLEDIEPSLLYPAHLYTLAESSNQDHLDLVDTFIQERLNSLDNRIKKRTSSCKCSEDIVRSLVDSLQCPVCYKTSLGNVYQCEHGHVMCGSCRSRLRSCPVCRVVLNQPIRNLALEQLARLL
ncbi:uncharacterized protein LOC111696906 isoform X3 [Eurytemora carolleeae]|uniref:uncharacterized protein LOC111696906 isoform X3 n=1 Tax=Eurytemora carolleeae TaxID=1294199 RepID=UPI000C774B88|nr:uncharacterized protein LOC111696906 isoform X3 [Eurytemora carolleeae]|eukprot:XP_023322452.1 uncharacterized protein LOC111696906 isoform X3 [Eurytemora affinis]